MAEGDLVAGLLAGEAGLGVAQLDDGRLVDRFRLGALAERVDVVAQLAELVGELGRDGRDPAVEGFEADGEAGDLGPDGLELGGADRRSAAGAGGSGGGAVIGVSSRSVRERILEPSSALAASDSSSRSRQLAETGPEALQLTRLLTAALEQSHGSVSP